MRYLDTSLNASNIDSSELLFNGLIMIALLLYLYITIVSFSPWYDWTGKLPV